MPPRKKLSDIDSLNFETKIDVPNSLKSQKIIKNKIEVSKTEVVKNSFPEKSQVVKSISSIKNNESVVDKINNFLLKFSRIPAKEKLFFVRNLSTMLRVGISISKAIRTLSLQTQNKYFKNVLDDIAVRVDNGKSFSESLKFYPKVFGDLFVNMIEAGELSGKLEGVLNELYVQMKKENTLMSKVRGALTYPAVILVAMLGISTFMIIVVVPKLTANFIEMNVELPLPTKILIAVSGALINHGIISAIILVVLVLIFMRFVKTEKGKSIFDRVILKIPVVSMIIKKINLARFSRNLSSLLKTDIMIVKSFEISSGILGNTHYRKAVLEMGSKIKKGENLSEAIKKYPDLFPPIVSQMIAIGEETGDLDNILSEIAEFYEEEVDQIMTDLPSLIEPILILVLGVGIGGIAVSIIMPMYKITEAV